MRVYQQLTLVEREIIYGMLRQGETLRSIGKKLRRSHTSISRELRRNIKYGNEYFTNEYLPCKAQKLSDKRKVEQRYKAPLKNPAIFLYVRKHLRDDGWSPEVIAGKLRLDHPELSICHETIYQYIYSKKVKTRGMHLEQYLILKRKKRMKHNGRSVRRHSKIPEAVSIDHRPRSVQRRRSIGHWETDNIIGRVTDKTALSVTVERMTRFTIITKLKDRTAQTKAGVLIDRLQNYPIKTMTADNGSENTRHVHIAKELKLSMYFCHAYHSWEKGTVENTNGRIRRFIPKGVSIDQIPDAYIAALEDKLNSTPRKCLQFQTPYEMMHKLRVTTA
ncbi:MAG TPA: IS30 family transposase [Candidatus Acidoferrales bacterium]|nr:IS30 family transposase [Candidatus Acidoferrales bacterium]